MEDAILAYLNLYGQPQSVAAIAEHGLTLDEQQARGLPTVGGFDPSAPAAYAVLEATLEGMVAAGSIQRVQAGVHAGGQPTLEYAPIGFNG